MNSTLQEFILEAVRSLSKGKKFNLNNFSSIDDPAKMLFYAWDKLDTIGDGGSSRMVFVLSSGKALKLAYGQDYEAGIEQNKKEYDVYLKMRNSPLPIVPKVYKVDDYYRWIIVELVYPLTSHEFFMFEKQVMRQDFRDEYEFGDFLQYAASGNFKKLNHLGVFKFGMALAQAIHRMTSLSHVLVGDLMKRTSWGRNANGNIVVLDSGLDVFTYNKHYRVPSE